MANARSVDQILISDWTAVGGTAPVPKYSVDIGVTWTKNDGSVHNWSGTRTFPNVLALVPLKDLKQMMEDIVVQIVRVELGIDEWSGG